MELRVSLGRGPGTSPCRNSMNLEQLCHILPPGTEQSAPFPGVCAPSQMTQRSWKSRFTWPVPPLLPPTFWMAALVPEG